MLPIHGFPNHTIVNWEENRKLWVHGFQIHGKFLVPKSVNWEVTLFCWVYKRISINSVIFQYWCPPLTTSNIFQYFLTAMPDSHSLILNMIQQIEKNSFKLFFTRSGWLKKNIKVNTTSGKIQYFFSIIHSW